MPGRNDRPYAAIGSIEIRGRCRLLRYLAGVAVAVAPCASSAQQTATYSYDALGRLVTSSLSRPQGNVTTSVTHDAASNRSRYEIAGTLSRAASISSAERNAQLNNSNDIAEGGP